MTSAAMILIWETVEGTSHHNSSSAAMVRQDTNYVRRLPFREPTWCISQRKVSTLSNERPTRHVHVTSAVTKIESQTAIAERKMRHLNNWKSEDQVRKRKPSHLPSSNSQGPMGSLNLKKYSKEMRERRKFDQVLPTKIEIPLGRHDNVIHTCSQVEHPLGCMSSPQRQ